MSDDHTNSTAFSLAPSALEFVCDAESSHGLSHAARMDAEQPCRKGAASVALNQREPQSSEGDKRPFSVARHQGPIMARSARLPLHRCKVSRRWLAKFGEGAPEPRLNRAQRRRKGAGNGGPAWGPRASSAGADGPLATTRARCALPGVQGAAPPGLVHTCKHFVSPGKSLTDVAVLLDCEGPPTRGPALYPPRLAGVWSWRHRVTKALDALVEGMPHGRARKGLSHRSRKLAKCGTVAKVRECSACGVGRAGSGRYAHPCDDTEGSEALPWPCEARSCWLCQRRRAAPLREWLAGAVSSLALPSERHRWTFVTVSPQYAPDDPSELSPEGLRSRLDAVRAAVRAIVREGRKAIHAAFVAFELSGTGHVHAHAMVASTYLDARWIDRTAALAGGREVHVWIEEASADSAREVAKYTAKLCSPLDEGALAGERRELMAPELAAAWEVATYGARLHERFGALRRLRMPEGGEPPAPADTTTHCASCGTVGEWRWSFRPLRRWVEECRRRGVAALDGSIQLDRRTKTPWDRAFDGSGRRATRAQAR